VIVEIHVPSLSAIFEVDTVGKKKGKGTDLKKEMMEKKQRQTFESAAHTKDANQNTWGKPLARIYYDMIERQQQPYPTYPTK